MRTLRGVSTATVLCTVPLWLYVVPQLLVAGVVEVGSSIEIMVVFPTIAGLALALIAMIVGVAGLALRSVRDRPGILMVLGQLTTVASAIAIVVWALAFASTGWELLLLPMSLMLGQLVVAAGVVDAHRRGRSGAPGPA